MKHLALTLPTPEENLACDEALLDQAETSGGPAVLRFWEPQQPFVVLGYAGKVAAEVNLAACAESGVPILRRCSGGGTVLQGPGCLNYALVLPIDEMSRSITHTNQDIMRHHQQALACVLGREVLVQGVTDLTLGARKFSGNSQRRRRRFLLFHGTFLLQLDLGLVERCLRHPPRQPDYRQQRSHADFLVNLEVPAETIQQALRECWQAKDPMAASPPNRIARLVGEKYTRPDWNLR